MLFIHIGAHKCGSSSIQRFMSLNARSLAKHGVVYPEIEGKKEWAHHRFLTELEGDRQSSPRLSRWTDIRKFAESNPDKRIVLSTERLETLRTDTIAELKRQFSDVPVTILAYTRETAEALPSRYNQLTKTGINSRDFDGFYERYAMGSRRFWRYFANWGNVFGWESFRIRSLDKRSLVGGNLIEDFLSVLGLSISDLGGSDIPGLDPANVSPGWKSIEILRALFTALKPEVERHENNPNRINAELGFLVGNACQQIMSDLGYGSERVQYLNARQKAECDAVYARGIKNLNNMIAGPKLPLPLPAPASERPFLPAIEHIPRQERLAIADRLGDKLESNRQRLDRAGLSSALQQQLIELVREPRATIMA